MKRKKRTQGFKSMKPYRGHLVVFTVTKSVDTSMVGGYDGKIPPCGDINNSYQRKTTKANQRMYMIGGYGCVSSEAAELCLI